MLKSIFKFYFSLYLIFILYFFHIYVQPIDGSTQRASVMDISSNKTIDLCCRWDKQISDGVLEYKLVNLQEKQKEIVREAFDSWNKQLISLRLVEVHSNNQKAGILVTVGDISKGDSNQLVRDAEAGQIAGQSVNNLNQDGLITNASILLSDEIFNTEADSSPLFGVVLHEIGHVLGLGHANFDDLMNPVVTGDVKGISVCDVKGVTKTNGLTLKKEMLSPLRANHSEHDTLSIEC